MTRPPLEPRLVTLVVVEPRGVLPPFEIESPWKMESQPVVDGAREHLGVDVTVLRVLEGGPQPGGPVTYLVEAPDVDAARLGPHHEALARPTALRPDYAEPGGIARLTSWADDALASIGAERRGGVMQIRTWNLSCLLRMETSIGRLWLKAVPPFFAHEGALIELLARRVPGLVPEPVAVASGQTLMRDTGGVDGYEIGAADFMAAVRRISAVMSSCPATELRQAGVPEYGREAFVDGLEDLAERHGDELSAEGRRRLHRLIEEAPDRWLAAGDRMGLVHGDLHGGNMRLLPDADVVVLDWGDGVITHPLMELAVLDSYAPPWADQVIEPWLEIVGHRRADWDAFGPLAALRLALVYRSFCDRIEPDERFYHRSDIVPALEKAVTRLRP